RLRKVMALPWQLATSADRRWNVDDNQATPRLPTRVMQGYLTRLLRVAMTDPSVSEAFAAVQQMIAPPTTLFSPRVVWRVLTTPLSPNPPDRSREHSALQEVMSGEQA